MALSPDELAAIVAAVTATLQPAVTAEPTQDKSKATASKSAVIHRNFDPMDVATGGEDVCFRVVAHAANGTPHRNGARIIPLVDGKVYRSLNADMLRTLTPSVVKELLGAVEAVNKRARLADHAPTDAEREAARAQS